MQTPPPPGAPEHSFVSPGLALRQSDGGWIAGAEGAAYALHAASASAIPVLIAVPHAGRCYPADVLARLRRPEMAALRLEDRLVDRIGEAVAAQTGASLLVARAARAVIDLNRAEDDIDWDMLGTGAPRNGQLPGLTPALPGAAMMGNGRARAGLGLVPRRVPGLGELWQGRLSPEELATRINGIHRPYHAALSAALEDIRVRWGAALLIDLHSMPPLPAPVGQGGGAAELVLGDRFGASCSGALIATAFARVAACGRRAAHNRPYAGGYVLDRHAAPRRGIHAFQVEICRATYLDSRLVDLGAGFDSVAGMVAGIVRSLAEEVAVIGARATGGSLSQGWADAAE
ncbi:N-formylglutamate amidohydrolase [Novosphingobium sp. FSY-8]|uniref:N-formylglutamate amidohydrolase n=1 Tax=Novosphingobium ovatum TaxID=1908523 RepID=A0ABW9XAN2_9SPHN|nr:N-formylglutamate amidohydrolase [Novosphingobium ovatum]NBC35592.1 N-formylglutamate amidohydrolase [Novosphingobium ovatum]